MKYLYIFSSNVLVLYIIRDGSIISHLKKAYIKVNL